jgi:hypothetical protein
MTDLVLVTDAARMLAEARTLPDIRRVQNLAQRAQEYAKAARGAEQRGRYPARGRGRSWRPACAHEGDGRARCGRERSAS